MSKQIDENAEHQSGNSQVGTGGSISARTANIAEKNRFSSIWFLPIIAVLIGAGMVYSDWQNRGIHVEITFDTAEGLVAEKTLVKNRNVDIGFVTAVGFNDDKSKILVELEIDNSLQEFLQQDSQFWVVRPRIDVEGVSGLSTLLTGAFIEVAPGNSGVFSDKFVGLERPPITAEDAAGLHLRLISKGGKQLRIGDPVIFSGFEVGRVESFEFNSQLREASYGVFVEAPYDELITDNTFFWNVSGVTLETSADGISVDIGSIDTFIRGGVQFDVMDGATPGNVVAELSTFELFDSKQSIAEQRSYRFLEYIVLVDDSVAGLYRGAPVEYRGIRLGTVENQYLGFDRASEITDMQTQRSIPVLIRIEPGRVSEAYAQSIDSFEDLFEGWIKDGLTAFIDAGNLLTGSSKISLLPDGDPIDTVAQFGPYRVIPSAKGRIASIIDQADAVLTKIEELPIEELLIKFEQLEIEELIANLSKAVNTADGTLLVIEDTLKELGETLDGLEPNSAAYQALEKTLQSLQTTINSAQPLIQELSNKPNSLIFGGTKEPDLLPRSTTVVED